MKTLFVVLIVFLFTVPSCKKGENDPLLSLHNRKARVSGLWKMTLYKRIYTFDGAVESFIGDGSQYTLTRGCDIPGCTQSGKLSIVGEFKKDGTYILTKNWDFSYPNSITSAGTWNFTDGVGKLKSKSQIMIYDQAALDFFSVSKYHYYVTFDLTELRNKKMVWHFKQTQSGSVATETIEEEIVWEQK